MEPGHSGGDGIPGREDGGPGEVQGGAGGPDEPPGVAEFGIQVVADGESRGGSTANGTSGVIRGPV
jgi:hypothetical protein